MPCAASWLRGHGAGTNAQAMPQRRSEPDKLQEQDRGRNGEKVNLRGWPDLRRKLIDKNVGRGFIKACWPIFVFGGGFPFGCQEGRADVRQQDSGGNYGENPRKPANRHCVEQIDKEEAEYHGSSRPACLTNAHSAEDVCEGSSNAEANQERIARK